MNTINIPNLNFDDRYDRMVNNIICDSFPQNNCILCHSHICSCKNKNVYHNTNTKIIYNSFNTEIEKRNQSYKHNKNLVNLNKMKKRPINPIFYNDINKIPKFYYSTTRDPLKKKLNNNFQFYNNNEAKTIQYNNNFENIRNESYQNIHNNYTNNKISLINFQRLNNSVSGRLAVPYLNNLKTINSFNGNNNNYINNYYYNDNDNLIAITKHKNSLFTDRNYSIEKEKNSKFRKIFNINEEQEINMPLEKPLYESYSNLHKNQLNIKFKMKKNLETLNPISPLSNNKFSNIMKRNNSQINNNRCRNNNNYLNINNNYNYQINNNNIVNIPSNSIEIIRQNYSNNFYDMYEKDFNKNIIRLKRKNITLKNKETVKLGEDLLDKKENKTNNINNKNPINKMYKYYIPNSKRISKKIYYIKNKTDFSDDNNKENVSNNIIQNSILKDNKNRKINMKFFEKMKKNYIIKEKPKILTSFEIPNNKNSSVNSKIFSNNGLNTTNNQVGDINSNIDNENNNNKIKTLELKSLLKKANNEISKLKIQLNNFNNKKATIINYKKINSDKLLNKNRINFQKKNSLKIKIEEGIYTKNHKNYNTNYDSKTLIKELILLNRNFLKRQKSPTTLNSLEDRTRLNNFYKNLNSNINKITYKHKYIFSIYHSKKKNLKTSIICFDAEAKLFEIKYIDSINNNKIFYDTINKTNKSLYLINKNDFYILTGLNCNQFFKYNYKNNRINQLSDLRYNHSNGAMISFNDKIICLSGDYCKKVEIFSEDDNLWFDLPDIQIERSFFSTCLIKNRFLFVFFGYNFPNRTYLNSIEYLDLFYYNSFINKNKKNENKNIFWRYLEYNYFSNNSSYQKINLIGSIAINYNDERIIFLGGKNCLLNEKIEGYYQLVLLDNTNIKGDEMNNYIELINSKNIIKSKKNNYFNNYKYIKELNHDNILKESAFVAFDNYYNVHLIKLGTMNHEIYNISINDK